MNADRTDRKVTIEDLLRIKRAERPPADFWAKFERDLRAKQLAAIVAKRPWWHAIPRVLTSVARLRLPLGATAVLALTFVAMRHQAPQLADPVQDISPVQPSLASIPVHTNDDHTVMPIQSVEVTPAVAQVESSGGTLRTEELPTLNPGEAAQVIALVGAATADRGNYVPAGAARSARLIVETEADLIPTTNSRALSKRPAVARNSAEPLEQIRTPMDDRLAKFLTSSLSDSYAAESEQRPSARPAEATRTRFGRGGFNGSDEVSRFGTYRGGDGAGVSIKL